MSSTKYAKHNKVQFKSSEDRENGIRMFNEFFKTIEKDNKEQKMTGHIILESMSDSKEAIVLTFWETKDHMDRFYSLGNSTLENLVERVKPLLEKMPERTDYAVSEELDDIP
jgi:galactose-1-phosphate uridylyltransferase